MKEREEEIQQLKLENLNLIAATFKKASLVNFFVFMVFFNILMTIFCLNKKVLKFVRIRETNYFLCTFFKPTVLLNSILNLHRLTLL